MELKKKKKKKPRMGNMETNNNNAIKKVHSDQKNKIQNWVCVNVERERERE